MKVVRHNQTHEFQNSPVCIATEYPLGDKDINIAVIKLTGRYPDRGRVVNLKCKELAYIIQGSGKVTVEGKGVSLQKGDAVLIEPGEKYCWEGNLMMLISCSPAWHPEQHKKVK